MYTISKNIYNSIKDIKIKLEEIDIQNRLNIMDCVKRKYIDTNKKGGWLWEKLTNFESMCDSNAWSYIKYFVLDKECILFFNQNEEKKMFLLQNGNDLNYILSETCGFEFYVTDRRCSYLICFNHHDILYGCGEACEWINDIKIEMG